MLQTCIILYADSITHLCLVDFMERTYKHLDFPRDDLLSRIPQETIDAALDGVQPLSTARQAEAQDANASPSLELLQEYQSRGQKIRAKLSVGARNDGNAAFAKGGKLKGQSQKDAYVRAIGCWLAVANYPPHAEVAHCNISAAALKLKE